MAFHEDSLFTHKALGPAVLQASNYWQPGESLLLTGLSIAVELVFDESRHGGKRVDNLLSDHAQRLAQAFAEKASSWANDAGRRLVKRIALDHRPTNELAG